MQSWKPDTCKCIILEESGTSNYISHEFVCPDHQGLSSSELATVPLEHNKRKNLVDGILRTNLTSLLTTTDTNGAVIYKNGITFNWSFSGTGNNRVLSISMTGVNLTTNQKNTIQNICDTQFGAGKVLVG